MNEEISPQEAHPRIGSVDINQVSLIHLPSEAGSPEWQKNTHRLASSEQVVQSLQQRGIFRLEQALTETLDALVEEGNLQGMIIGNTEGMPIACSTSVTNGEIWAAITSLFETVSARILRESLLGDLTEMTLRDAQGHWIVVRAFTEIPGGFILAAYASKVCSCRQITNLAIRQCGRILQQNLTSRMESQKQPKP